MIRSQRLADASVRLASSSNLPRAALARASCLLVAIAVLLGIAQAGARYFYCEELGLSASDPCAQGATRLSPCPLASFGQDSFDCCQVLTMRSMPEGARSIVPVVPSAGPRRLVSLHRSDASSWNGTTVVAREGERGRAAMVLHRTTRAIDGLPHMREPARLFCRASPFPLGNVCPSGARRLLACPPLVRCCAWALPARARGRSR